MKVKKAKALGAMEAAKDMGEEFCDPARKENILGRRQTRLELCEEHLKKDPIIALDKALWACLLVQSSCRKSREVQWPAVGWAQAFFAKDVVRLRTASTHWNVPGKYGPHGELFFFLRKEQVASNEV